MTLKKKPDFLRWFSPTGYWIFVCRLY